MLVIMPSRQSPSATPAEQCRSPGNSLLPLSIHSCSTVPTSPGFVAASTSLINAFQLHSIILKKQHTFPVFINIHNPLVEISIDNFLCWDSYNRFLLSLQYTCRVMIYCFRKTKFKFNRL